MMDIEDISNEINMSESPKSNEDMNESYENKTQKNKGIFNFYNKNNHKKTVLSTAEIRLKKDMEELIENENLSKHCDIILNGYKKIENSEDFQMIIEFINHFSVKFIITKEFPFEPPKISFLAGNQYPFLFDSYGNIILDLIEKQNWSPTFWISKLVLQIEQKIYQERNSFNSFNIENNDFYEIGNIMSSKKRSYDKRNWNDYLNELKTNESIEYYKFTELKGNKINNLCCNY